MSKILVTGGSGMVGKHLQEIMPDAIYISSKDVDLCCTDSAYNFMRKIQPDVVVHLAAKVGGIMDNIKNPVQFYEQNTLINNNVVTCSYLAGCKRIIGMLSTCTYPDHVHGTNYPLHEADMFSGPPAETNYSYAMSKRGLYAHLKAYNKECGTRHISLAPCNLYGEHDHFNLETCHFVSAVLKRLYDAHVKGEDKITLYGTGKPLRQFMYAGDLALVIKEVIERDICFPDLINVATDEVYSILQIANIARHAIGYTHINIDLDRTKPDGQFRKDVSSGILLGLLPNFKFTPLEDGIRKTFNKKVSEWSS